MNSPALPLPPGPMLAGGRPARWPRTGGDAVARPTVADRSTPDGALPVAPATPMAARMAAPLGTAAYSVGSQRRLGLLVLGLHIAAVWGLMQLGPVRDTLREVAPVMVSLIHTPAASPASPPPLPAPPKAARPEPAPLLPPPPVVVQSAAPAPPPQPVHVVADPAPAVTAPTPPAATAQPATTATPSPAVAPVAAGPRMLPSAAVQYLVPPVPEVPRASRRLNETGRVIVRVLITEAGLPDRLSVERSSGFARLDEAALAAVRKARFRPYTENGQPQSGWALVPVSFELEP
ncbi:energy transducer TonB [Ideonella sp. DXS22W]|uniref:Energy transducer TonB n=1 Tax=Pseudaquabacterium inlustre TaxID=2984192 RepID=A0ABU9CGP5_9BURK